MDGTPIRIENKKYSSQEENPYVNLSQPGS
jgi:hypothetical protein